VLSVLVLDFTRTGIVILFFIYASWSDYKSREVSDTVWLLLAPLSFALTFSELLLNEPSQMIPYSACFGVTTAFAIVLYYSGGFGGADAKALMCLALALPFYPENLFTPLAGQPSPISKAFFPITVFSNSVLFAALTAVAILLYNLTSRLRTRQLLFEEDYKNESLGKKILVLITGYKVSITRLKEKWHVYPMEDVEENAEGSFKRKLVILPKDEGRSEIVERLDRAIQAGNVKDKVWATPGLPMLIFVTAGLIVALFAGDVVWLCIRLVLG
jgi:preflagellin peptidase FlaK